MAWKRVNNKGNSNSNILKWDTPGKIVEGIWNGISEGRFGELGDIGGTRFPLLTVLDRALREISVGTKVKATYIGWATSNKGTQYKDFNVDIDE